MNIKIALITIIMAGLMNGSFAAPTRLIKNSNPNKIWLLFSLIGFIIMPYIFLRLLIPNYILIYKSLPEKTIITILFGGILFGIGQSCFFKAINKIGIALSFTLNLSLGMIVGSLFVLFYQNKFLSYQGALVTASVVLILSGLIINYLSKEKNSENISKSQNKSGWLLASIAGLASGLQNITFIITAFHNNEHYDSFIIWPLFLTTAALPIIISLSHEIKKFNLISLKKTFNLVTISLILLMSALFSGSLVLYSTGMNYLPISKHAVGWPLFMIFIILASQTWGILFHEDGKLTFKKITEKGISVFFIIVAIILLTKAS